MRQLYIPPRIDKQKTFDDALSKSNAEPAIVHDHATQEACEFFSHYLYDGGELKHVSKGGIPKWLGSYSSASGTTTPPSR
jgi:hypothetical protein